MRPRIAARLRRLAAIALPLMPILVIIVEGKRW
jgi:hypothetical protein